MTGNFRWFIFLLAASLFSGCGRGSNEVILYTSQDQVFVEPLLKKFQADSGIVVRSVFDNESVKTVSLVNRLHAEKGNPQCDLFWNNESFRSFQLAQEGLVDPRYPVKTFGFRTRRIVVHDPPPAGFEIPSSFRDLTNKSYFGKIGFAYPIYGTTGTHFLALRQQWGTNAWLQWCQALQANKPFIVDGNSAVVRLVASGEIWLGMTDSDDIASAREEHVPVKGLPLSVDSLRIPNSIAHIAGARHVENAEKLALFLQLPETIAALQEAHALEKEGQGTTGLSSPPDFQLMLADLKTATEQMLQLFKK
ncbi:MAG: extracellular solute-binding protein family 1 [Verrucomicrobiales bacterium]|nr:extracellular solute-binding protein family 1 [Verrucomicrobiales bacterium]